MNIILCGPPFTGKTTLGRLVAEQLQCEFKDTDHLLEKCYAKEKNIQMSCREIYRQEGEEIFRHYESRAVASLQDSQRCVIALGGGCLNKTNSPLIKKLGSLLYIKTSLDILQKRLHSMALPAYLEKEKNPQEAYKKIVEARSIFYEKYADRIIDADSLSQFQIITIISKVYYGQ